MAPETLSVGNYQVIRVNDSHAFGSYNVLYDEPWNNYKDLHGVTTVLGTGNFSFGNRNTLLGRANYAYNNRVRIIGEGNRSDSYNTFVAGKQNKVGTDGALRSKFDFVGDSGYTYGKFRTNVDGGDSIGIGNDIKLLARRAVAIGKNVNLTRSATHGVAIGLETAVSQYGGIALGYAAEADRAKGMAGWDPVTGRASTNTGSASKATSAAVSIGRKRTALPARLQEWQQGQPIPMPSTWHS